MAKLNLGTPREDAPPAVVCPWKIAAIALVGLTVVGIACWLPGSLLELIQQAVIIIGGYFMNILPSLQPILDDVTKRFWNPGP